MSSENSLSLHFYQYLRQKIGYEEEVKVRRLTNVIDDLGIPRKRARQFTSGSRGEGLKLKGSDIDIMFIDSSFKVYESEKDAVLQSMHIPLVMDTEDTHPCFTQLRLLNDHESIFNPKQIIKKTFLGRKFSSELYRQFHMEQMLNTAGVGKTSNYKTHGPCITDVKETHDFAFCFKCDKWISKAQPWIIRPRTTWPSPDLFSNIISFGVLYVPIGYKGSRNECLQWRISFSVAEKILIFSFNHTQLLCYALLKILIKEIVEKEEDLKTLLCSFFLKTLMFWISEESEQSMWRPEKIIQCFMACLNKLIYCVEYSTLLHYFIPDNNLFYLRFEGDKKVQMISILKNLYKKGIYCFAGSETLFDIMRVTLNTADSSISRYVISLHTAMSTSITHNHQPQDLLFHFLHHSRTKFSRNIFFEMLTFAHKIVPQISQNDQKANNKHKYNKYKRDRSHLLIGTNSDAVGGWLMLASFFYVNENYLLSLNIINHTLRKCTNEKIYPWQFSLSRNHENVLHLFTQTELCTISKRMTIKNPNFREYSPISPRELQLNVFEQYIPLYPLIFAHFLTFLCFYHLHEYSSYQQSLLQLQEEIVKHLTTNPFNQHFVPLCITCLGIAHQMIGETDRARKYFLLASQLDEYHITSAATRLSSLD